MIENDAHNPALRIFLNVSADYFGVNYNRSITESCNQSSSELLVQPSADGLIH
jgi:hypothetical protein